MTDNTPGKYCQEEMFFREALQELGDMPFEGSSIKQLLSSLAKAHAVGVSQKPLFDYETGEGWALTPLGAVEARIEGSLTQPPKLSKPTAKERKKILNRSPRRKTPSVKLTIYLPPESAKEIRVQADRLERSISWLITQAWKHARDNIADMPGYTKDGASE